MRNPSRVLGLTRSTLACRSLPRRGRALSRLNRRGTAALEFMVLLPLLISLCLVAVDLGRFGYLYLALSQATRAGGDYAATHNFNANTQASWETQVEDAIAAEMSNVANFQASDLNIQIQTSQDSDGLHHCEIEATYPFAPVVGWPGFANGIVLRRQLTTRQYQ